MLQEQARKEKSQLKDYKMKVHNRNVTRQCKRKPKAHYKQKIKYKSDYKLQRKRSSKSVLSLLHCFLITILKHTKEKWKKSSWNSQRQSKHVKDIHKDNKSHKAKDVGKYQSIRWCIRKNCMKALKDARNKNGTQRENNTRSHKVQR